MSKGLRITILAAAIVLVATGAVILFLYNPETAGIYPQCPSKVLTGYECAGCGSLRATHALLHGRFGAAWHFNPAVFFALALLAIIAVAGIHRHKSIAVRCPAKIQKLSRQTAVVTDSPWFPIAILAAVLAWTICRNL